MKGNFKILAGLLLMAVSSLFFLTSCEGNLTINDGDGYIKWLDESNQKAFMHLEGTAYEMGHQHGYLLAEEVKETCADTFFKELLLGFIEGDKTLEKVLDSEFILGSAVDAIAGVALAQSAFIPEEMKQEMRGIADGAKKALEENGIDTGEVSYAKVLMTNIAFDLLLSYAYPFIVQEYMDELQKAEFESRHPEINTELHMCDGFIAKGDATENGNVIMSRSFMIPDVITRRSVIMEYNPNNGNKFVACNTPGFVGTAVAMNDKGLSLGIDMITTIKTNPVFSGMGCLLTGRKAIQYGDNVNEASDIVENVDVRAVSWLFVLADKTTGAVAESGHSYLIDARNNNNFFLRTMDYTPDNLGETQWENSDDLICLANHFVNPEVIETTEQHPVNESLIRQNLVYRLAQDEINRNGINFEEAKKIANYLCPLSSVNPYTNFPCYRFNNKPDDIEDDLSDLDWGAPGSFTAVASDFDYPETHTGGVLAIFEPAEGYASFYYRKWTDPWIGYKFGKGAWVE